MARDAGAQAAPDRWTRRGVVAGFGAAVLATSSRSSWAADWQPARAARLRSASAAATTDSVATSSPVKVVTRPPEWRRLRRPTDSYESQDSLSSYFGSSEVHFLSDIIARLKDPKVGYLKVFCFALTDGGSLLVTPFERITRDGSPARKDRFNLEPSKKQNPLGEKPIPLHVRSFMYLLSQHPLEVGDSPKNFKNHQAKLDDGISQLSNSLQFPAITPRHRLTTFLYEYRAEREGEPVFVPKSRVSAFEQLKKSKII